MSRDDSSKEPIGSDSQQPAEALRVERRQALKLGMSAVAALFAEGAGAPSYVGVQVSGVTQARRPGATAGTNRADAAATMRIDAARSQQKRAVTRVAANGDERRYANLIASYSKGLPHSSLGEVDRAAFDQLVSVLSGGHPLDLDAVPTAGVIRQVNPQASFAFTLEGPDPHSLFLPAPPRFDSAEQAAEACELYWQALTRDVPFRVYDTNPTIAEACADLSRLSAFRGPKANGAVTPAVIFRGATPGDRVGPYVSQFLLKEVPYGAIRLVPQVRTATPGLDYMVTWDDWLEVQNGAATVSRHAGAYRYIRSARDLTAYVQLDFTYQAFLTACLIQFGMEGTTDVRRPYKGAPYDAANPYRRAKAQSGFSTFGVAHILDLVARVANLALQHAWYHKWLVHRWLRPEEYGGRVHVHRSRQANYPLHQDILSSPAPELAFTRHRSFLLPQAYPEGAPLHPSYPSGHATIAGACATVLKAFFDESFPIEEPVVAREDGLTLEPYVGPTLTVGGELNKLAANVAIARNAAGIHWRSDSAAGLLLGEAIAIDLLGEMRVCFSETFDGFSLTRFDGSNVTV